jgi:hypothetical protein
LIKVHGKGAVEFHGLEKDMENLSKHYKSEIREEKQTIKQEQDRGITHSR